MEPEELADLVIANMEERAGDMADVTLVSLHLALADQIVAMLQGGATAADIDPVIESVWNRLRDIWAGTGPQTHRNDSAYVC